MTRISLFDNSKYYHQEYSDIEYVQGLLSDQRIRKSLYKLWNDYFNIHGKHVFFNIEAYKNEIILNTYEVLWNKVSDGIIYVGKDGKLRGANDQPFNGSLLTYMMGIAKRNYLELVRKVDDGGKRVLINDIAKNNIREGKISEAEIIHKISKDSIEEDPFISSSYDKVMLDIISDLIAKMQKNCNQILTMFYYQEKKLDDILKEMDIYSSKNALKTAKYKCLSTLKEMAIKEYRKYLNN